MGLRSRLKHLKGKHLTFGLAGAIIGSKQEEEKAKKEAQKAKEQQEREAALEEAKPEVDYTAIEEQLAARPKYEIPSEVAEFQETMGTKAGQIEDISFAGAERIREEAGLGAERMRDLGQQYTDIYQTRAGRTEMPGAGIMETQARSTTGAYLSALERFGASPASVGQAFRAESQALQNIAMQNAQYRDRAQTDYAQALMGQAGLEQQATGLLTGAEASATGMQTGALATGAEMIGRGQMMGAKYADQAYQLNELSPYYDKLNLETMKTSNVFAQQMAEYGYQRDLELGRRSLDAQREIAEEQNKGFVERWTGIDFSNIF